MFLAASELPPIEKSTGGNDRRDLNTRSFLTLSRSELTDT